MLERLSIWLSASRPKTLWVSVAPVLIGSSLAAKVSLFQIEYAILTLLSAALIQIGTNFANDYFDYKKGADTNRSGPTRATSAGLVTPQHMKVAMYLSFAFAVAAAIPLLMRGQAIILYIGVASIIFGVLYTATPWALAYTGFADVVCFIFFGPVAVLGTYYIQTLSISTDAVILGLCPGAYAVAILTVNNLRDRNEDAKVNKRTLVVRFGRLFGLFLYSAALATALSAPIYLWLRDGDHGGFLALLLLTPIHIWQIRQLAIKQGAALNPILGQTALLSVIASAIISIAW